MIKLVRSLRFFFGIVGALATALACAATGWMHPSHRIPLFFNRLFARLFLPIVGIQLHVDGLRNVDFSKNYVVCSNHQGMFDIFSLMAAIPLPLRFISKPSYFRIPIIGWGMRGSGHIEITRTDSERDRQTLDRIAGLLDEGGSVVFFPEGTRSRDGSILPFKYGAFYTSIESGVSILPVTIRGSFERMRKGHLLPVPGAITLTIHPPISPAHESIASLMAKTRGVILSKI